MLAHREGRLQLLLAARRLIVVASLGLAATGWSFARADGGSGFPPLEQAENSFAGKVVGIADGDTISVMHNGRAERVRLEGIDCPESGQPFSRRAKETTSELVFGRVVVVEDRGRDRYGRTLGRVFVNGLDVSRELVRRGMAWHFKRYSSERGLADLEREARADRRGLWAEAAAVPPWEWRRARSAQ